VSDPIPPRHSTLPLDATVDEFGDPVSRPVRVRLYPGQAWILVATAVGIVVALLSLYTVRGFRFPLGADAPVYLWWARLASVDGLSAVGTRPGVPALLLVLSGTLGAPLTAVTAALEAVLAAVVGLAATALVRDRVGAWRWAWTLAGVLAGTFAVHLAIGYIASLTFATLFLAAAAMLIDRRTVRDLGPSVAAAALLGSGGLAHPIFLGVGAGILLLTALIVFLERLRVGLEQSEAVHLVGATLGGGAILGGGMLALLPGPGAIDAITSKDGLLRHAGLGGELAHLYRERLLQHWARYVEYISIPLGVVGFADVEDDLLQRFFLSWFAALVAGVAFCLTTGLAPPDRFVTFGFVVPILAGLGLARVFRWLRQRNVALAWILSVSLVGAMVAGAGITWWRQKPFIGPAEVAAATAAGSTTVDLRPAHFPLVFIVDDSDATAAFLAPRAENLIRASVPPDRIRDVHVYVGTLDNYLHDRPTLRGDPEFDALSRLYLSEIRAAGGPGNAMTFLLQPFAPSDFAAAQRGGRAPFAPGAIVLNDADLLVRGTVTGPFDTLDASSPLLTFVTGAGMLVLLFVVGFGWALCSARDPVHAFALAPAFGVAALILGGFVIDRVGVPLTGAGPPAISAVAAAGGYALWWWRRRNFLRRARERKPEAEAPA
jgi:hypothetical protein